MRIETRAVHAGRRIDPATGAVTAPIHLSTTFERGPDHEPDIRVKSLLEAAKWIAEQ